jgi:UDP-N-acetylglucosamine--N-acetylmuramyl-(pentapeptide) pyrophosphoryl-undecaprenol N-acetylglucosamine transferase
VSLPASFEHFPLDRTVLLGNPVRASIFEGRAERALEAFGLEPGIPVILATGGGTGALGLNRLVAAAAPKLSERYQIVHLTGRGRQVAVSGGLARYRPVEFVAEGMADLLAAASVVITRAGMGTLSELSALGKPALIVPMPASHQRANALAFTAAGAAISLEQEGLSAESLASAATALLEAPERLAELSANMSAVLPKDSARRLARRLLELAERRRRVQP